MKDETDKTSENGNESVATDTAQEMPVPTPQTPEQLEDLKEKASKADEYWERLLRQAADFENFKKRAAREKQDAIKYANEGLLHKLIPIVDNFEMALAATNTASTDPSVESLKKGIQMVHSLLRST